MKKMISLLMAVLMLASVFAGCGSSRHSPAGNDQDSEAAAQTTPTVLPELCEPTVNVTLALDGNDVLYDADGIKITLTEVESRYLDITTENNSDKMIQFFVAWANTNGIGCSSNYSEIIYPGTTQIDSLRYSENNLNREDMKYFAFSFYIQECASEEYHDFSGTFAGRWLC